MLYLINLFINNNNYLQLKKIQKVIQECTQKLKANRCYRVNVNNEYKLLFTK